MKNKHKLLLAASSILLAFSPAIGGTTWDGGGGDDNWGTGANWNDNFAPPTNLSTDLTFAGSTRLTPFNNYGAFNAFRSINFAVGAGEFVISGNSIDLGFKIENNSSVLQTANFANIASAGLALEFNPLNGDLAIGSTNIYTNGDPINIYGNNGHTVTFSSGTVISQGGSFNIKQNSVAVLNGANTYTGGTNVEAGTLLVNGNNSAASGNVVVSSGATLGGSGTLGGTTFVSGSVAPGTSGIDTLTVGNSKSVTWNSGQAWKFELGTTSGTSDLLNITGGDFNRGSGSVFQFDFLGTGVNDGIFTLINWSGGTNFTDPETTFTYTGLASGKTGSFSISGSQLDFTVIPELSNVLIGGLLGLGMLRRRRA